MKSIKKIVVVFLLLFSILAKAQDEKLPSYFSNQLQVIDLEVVSGFNNSLEAKSQERISTVFLKQIGDENVANIDNKSAQGEHKVYQIGNENNYQFLNSRSNVSINLGVLQAGNANSLKIVGTNSMFKNLRITQFGGAKMSVINY